MQCPQRVGSIQKPVSAQTFRRMSEEYTLAKYYSDRGIVVWASTGETGPSKLTFTNTIDVGLDSQLKSNPELLFSSNFRAIFILDRANTSIVSSTGNYVREFIAKDSSLLSHIDRALEILCNKVATVSEGVFYDIRPVPADREPGFIVDGWIVISEYDRNLEYAIYKELGNVLRNNPSLLFNIHIIASKGRKLSKIIPSNFRRYTAWSDYVC